MLHEINEVGLKELSAHLISGELLQEEEEDVETNLGHVAHGVFERPHNGVHE